MLTDNANVWPSGAPFDWNRNPRRAACPVCGRDKGALGMDNETISELAAHALRAIAAA